MPLSPLSKIDTASDANLNHISLVGFNPERQNNMEQILNDPSFIKSLSPHGSDNQPTQLVIISERFISDKIRQITIDGDGDNESLNNSVARSYSSEEMTRQDTEHAEFVSPLQSPMMTTIDDDDFDGWERTFGVDYEPAVVNKDAIDNNSTGINDRISWQNMLNEVMAGDIIKIEQKKLNETRILVKDDAFKREFWLGIRACAKSHEIEKELNTIELSRRRADEVFVEVSRFKMPAVSESNALEIVGSLLRRLSDVENCYPTLRDVGLDKPIFASFEFQRRIDALVAWHSTLSSLNQERKILNLWVGMRENEQLTVDMEDVHNILKPLGFAGNFHGLLQSALFVDLFKLLNKAKLTFIEFEIEFSHLHLLPFCSIIDQLALFPIKMMKEHLRIQEEKLAAIRDPTELVVNQLFDDVKETCLQAVNVKKTFSTTMINADGNLQDYKRLLVGCVKHYLTLLKKKAKIAALKQTDLLDIEWQFVRELWSEIEDARLDCVISFCGLAQDFICKVETYISDSSHEQKVYGKLVETMRLKTKKYWRFSRLLSSELQNACTFTVTDSDKFITNLQHSQATLICMDCDATPQSNPLYAFRVHNMIDGLLIDDFDVKDESFIVVYRSPRIVHWMGPTCVMEKSVPFNIATGTVLLIARNARSLRRVKNTFRQNFQDYTTEAKCLSPHPLIEKNLTAIESCICSMVNAVIDSVGIIKKNMKDHVDVEVIESLYSFAADISARARKYIIRQDRSPITNKLTQLAIEWVSFTCSDCNPEDRRTFRWAVMALEFVVVAVRGNNLLSLPHSQFIHLKKKVSCCMSLLITHFQLEEERHGSHDVGATLRNSIGGNTAIDSLKMMRKDRLDAIRLIEEARNKVLIEDKLMGKVLNKHNNSNNNSVNINNNDDDPLFIISPFVHAPNGRIQWQQSKYIGGGSFGSVYECINMDTGDMMAVKEIKFPDSKSVNALKKEMKNELELMRVLKHPLIVTYYGIELQKDKVYIFMEYCPNGSLGGMLDQGGRIENEPLIQIYTSQILQGLDYLHKKNVVHRDIKPDNILFDSLGRIKLVDFGAAKSLHAQHQTMTADKGNTLIGTPAYMSPEVITGENVSTKSDIWALGCIVLQLCTGKRPWYHLDNEWAIMYNLGVSSKHPLLPDKNQLSNDGIEFIKQCFIRSPTDRPSAEILLKDSFVAGIPMVEE